MDNVEKMVEMVTAEIMRRTGKQERGKRFLVLGSDPKCEIAECLRKDFPVEVKQDIGDAHNYDFVVLPAAYFDDPNVKVQTLPKAEACENTEKDTGKILDLSEMKLISERGLADKYSPHIDTIRISKKSIITSLAADFIRANDIYVERVE
jgi:hypothetical protein